MSARATAIAAVALLVLGVALIAQAWRMKDYSLNVSIARERRDDDPEMLRNYHRYFGATEVRFWSVAWICTGLLAQAGWVADDRRLINSVTGSVRLPSLKTTISPLMKGEHAHQLAPWSECLVVLRALRNLDQRHATSASHALLPASDPVLAQVSLHRHPGQAEPLGDLPHGQPLVHPQSLQLRTL
jgi:hypothetical protein